MQRCKTHLVRRLERPRRIWLVLLIAGLLGALNVASAVAALFSTDSLF
jgi:hypothetical protein